MTSDETPTFAQRENVYGSMKRLEWIASRLTPGTTAVEFGCGTGCQITLPLVMRGFDAYGVDLDAPSIEFGRRIASIHGVDPDRLQVATISDLGVSAHAIIASEVLEHIPSADLDRVLRELRSQLAPGDALLVTVPNGYGWFEIESLIWNRLGLSRLVSKLRIDVAFDRLRLRVLGHTAEDPYPNTLADSHSPHVQRFTAASIRALLRRNGFEVVDWTGSVLLAGPISNLIFRGAPPILAVNSWLGSRMPRLASGFFIHSRATSDDRASEHLAG